MSDDLLYHGDLNAALRRMMQQGFRDRNDEQLMGLREMLERLRERRREELERRDLGGVYDDIADQLDEVVDMEREGIDRRVDEATRSGDQRRQELVEDVAEERRRQLEEMPPDLAGRVQAMQNYEFMDDAARERFEELMDLRWQVDQLSRNLQEAFPNLPWQRSQNFSGDDPLQFGDMPSLLDTLGDLDALENLMKSATQPGELAEVDLDRARELLGDDAARSLDRLRELTKMLEDAGLIE